MLHSKFDIPHVKRNLISSIKNLIYDVPSELLSNLKLRIIENFGKISEQRGDTV